MDRYKEQQVRKKKKRVAKRRKLQKEAKKNKHVVKLAPFKQSATAASVAVAGALAAAAAAEGLERSVAAMEHLVLNEGGGTGDGGGKVLRCVGCIVSLVLGTWFLACNCVIV